MTLWLWVGWLAALLKVFNAPIVLMVSILLAAAIWPLLAPRGPYFDLGDSRDRVFAAAALILILAMVLCGLLFFHDSFGYRDDAVYAGNAMYLADQGELPYPVLDGTDSRLFLNTVWLAELYGLLGMGGFKVANMAACGIALFCVFMLVKELAGNSLPGLLAVALLSLCYPFVWFTRRTVNEVLFFSLCWICFYLAFRCVSPRFSRSLRLDLTLFMLMSVLTCFIRPEGLLVAGVGLTAAFYSVLVRDRRTRLFPRLLFIALVIVVLISGISGYRHMNRKYQKYLGKAVSAGGAEPAVTEEQGSGNTLRERQSAYSYWVMMRFGLLPAFLLIPPLFVILLFERRRRPYAVYLAIATLPFLYFVFDHRIVLDLPWFLRRFVAVAIPLALISFAVVVSRMRLLQALTVSLCYLSLTVFISAPVLFAADRPGTLALASEIAGQVPDGSLLLTDRYLLGNYSLTGLLRYGFGKNARDVSPYSTLGRKDIGDVEEVFLVTNLSNFCYFYDEGGRVFDSSVGLEGMDIVSALEADIPYFLPTADLNRGAYVNNWKSTDYRVALSYAEVPSKRQEQQLRILILRLRLGGREEDGGGG